MLTWEGSPIQGGAAIIEKLSVGGSLRGFELCFNDRTQGLPFQKVVHKVNTCDVQPTSTDNLLISITGLLVVCWYCVLRLSLSRSQIDDSENPLQFSQIFQIIKEGETYYVYVFFFTLKQGDFTNFAIV